MQGLKTFVGVDVQQTRDEDDCRHIFRVLKMVGSVPVDGKGFIQNVPRRNTLLTAGSRRWLCPTVVSTP